MKKLLLIGAVFFVLQATAQIPDYFSNNPEWRLFRGYEVEGSDCGVSEDMVYYINGDSIIGDTVYKKLFKRGVATEIVIIPDPDVFCSDSWLFDHLAALIRQENKKIVRRNQEGDEELYYDFDLVVGDTVPLTIVLPFANRPTINTIDSIWVGDNYFKRFHFVDNTSTYFFIEGIGHINGFIEPLDLFSGFYSEMYCYARNDSVVYTFEGGEWACDFSVSIVEQKTSEIRVSLFPNPANEIIHISVSENVKMAKVRVYNVAGLMVLKPFDSAQGDIASVEIQLDVGGLMSGMYLLEVETEDGSREVKRLVIE